MANKALTAMVASKSECLNAKEGWAIFSDSEKAPVMYTTSDGGQHWTQSHVFDKPAASGS